MCSILKKFRSPKFQNKQNYLSSFFQISSSNYESTILISILFQKIKAQKKNNNNTPDQKA